MFNRVFHPSEKNDTKIARLSSLVGVTPHLGRHEQFLPFWPIALGQILRPLAARLSGDDGGISAYDNSFPLLEWGSNPQGIESTTLHHSDLARIS